MSPTSYQTNAPELAIYLMPFTIAAVRKDDNPAGMRNNFESAVTYLLPSDPVVRKRKGLGNKGMTADVGSTTGIKPRYHKREEYGKLTKEQRDELCKWRETPEAKKEFEKSGSKRKANRDDERDKNKLRKTIVSVLKEQEDIKEKEKSSDEEQVGQIKEALVSFLSSSDSQQSNTSSKLDKDKTENAQSLHSDKLSERDQRMPR